LTGILVCALTALGATSRTETSVTPATAISVAEMNQRITEARQLLQESPTISRDSVRVAALNSTNGELTTIPLSKDEFLTKDANIEATTAAGEKVRVRVGAISEVAYYTSVHPALMSAELSSNGQSYIRTMLDRAAANLAAQGVTIPSDIVDIAEHLCVVEHTDHKRFMHENAGDLFPE